MFMKFRIWIWIWGRRILRKLPFKVLLPLINKGLLSVKLKIIITIIRTIIRKTIIRKTLITTNLDKTNIYKTDSNPQLQKSSPIRK
jgi:hypothetical protein